MQRHRLKREIIATAVTNSTINRMGATFMMRMQEDTGQGPAAIAKAYTAAREILGARDLWAQIEAQDSKVAENTQVDAIMQIWSLLRHITRWLLSRPGGTLEIAANVERYQAAVVELSATVPEVLTPAGKADFGTGQEKWEGLGLPADLALRLAKLPELRAMLDMVEVAQQTGQPIAKVANVFYELGQALDLNGCAVRSRRCRSTATGTHRRAVRCWTSSITSIAHWRRKCSRSRAQVKMYRRCKRGWIATTPR